MALTKITSRILDSSGVTTVGTISTGVWQGTAIDQTYLVGQSGTNTGDQTTISGNAGTVTNGVYTVGNQTIGGTKTFSSNVGIGTTSPSAKLTIDLGDSSSAPTTFTTSNSYLQLGTTSYNTAGAVYSIGFGYTGGSTNSPAYIGLKQTGTGNATKGDLVFLTRDSTNDIAPTERLRISSNGKVGIGTTTMHQDLNLISSSTSQSLINIGTSNSSRFLNVGVSGSAGYIMMENAAALNIGTGGVTRLSISSTGAATFNSSLAGFGAIITNNNDSSEGLLVRTSDNDGTQYILDLQSSSSATGTNYSSKFKVAKDGKVGIGVSPDTNSKLTIKGSGDSSTSNSIAVYNFANSSIFKVRDDGNVGIGTDSPDYQLDIENSSHAVLRLHAGTNSSASLRLKNDAIDWDVNTQTNDTFAIYSHTSNTQPFSILPNGNVGIGNTSPAQKLHILQPSYISPSTVQGLIRLTGQSYQENSGTTPSAGTSIEFYNKWNTGSEYSVARIAGRASQGYDGGLQFDVGSNSGPGGNGFTTAMSILADGKVTIQQGLTVGTDNTLAGSNYIKGDVYRPGAGNYVERIFDVSASSSGSSWIFARQFHDHVNWGNGNINVIIQGTYYGSSQFFKGDFTCRYGYSGGNAYITTNFNGGVPAPTWQGAINVGGNTHYRNLVFAAGAYTKYTIRIILTGGLVITSNATANSGNLVYIPNF